MVFVVKRIQGQCDILVELKTSLPLLSLLDDKVGKIYAHHA